MAFTLANTVAVDPTSTATRWIGERNGLLYFTDTFLPARGWAVNTSAGTSGTVKRGLAMPSYDLYNGNATAYSYSWFTIPTASSVPASGYSSIYEDATYTSVPGDSMSDTTNSITWYWRPSGSAGDASWKFWTSDEDNSLFLVTRGGKMIFWGAKGYFAFWDPNSDYTDDGSSDQYRTNYFPYCPYMRGSNLPQTTNTASTEWPVSFYTIIKYAEPREYSFMRNFGFKEAQYTVGYIDYNDVRQSVPDVSARAVSGGTTGLINTADGQPIYKITDGTDWWVTSSSPASHGLAFYYGTTEPDFS